MVTNGVTTEGFISALEVNLNTNYTEEQKSLIKIFGDGPAFCFADPGTGKTYTAIGGLITAELLKQIPGNNIYALSFTKQATAELSVRHEHACKSLHIAQKVNFSTLHALCRSILLKHHALIGMTKFESTGQLTLDSAYDLILNTSHERQIPIDPKKIKNVVKAVRSLNSALIFDRDNVESKMAFKECGIPYEVFDEIRGILFSYNLLRETISVSDLLLYTLMLMNKHPEVSDEFKSNCRLMLVDEAQDLSLLHLHVISKLTDNPIFIGDMKQQIYAFNGACQEIVAEFFNHYPTATKCELTQSFRCRQEIAEFATKIILPNSIGGENFQGVAPGGSVHIYDSLREDGLDITGLCEKLHRSFVENKSRLVKDYLFLFRNNVSAIPIIEELYKQNLPFRAYNYTPAYDIPVIKELIELLKICDNPRNLDNIPALRYLIPELRTYYNPTQNPIFQICKKTGCSIFEVNYEFKNMDIASKAMTLLLEVSEQLKRGETLTVIFNSMWSLYSRAWLKGQEWRLENPVDYYVNTVNALLHKTYKKFIEDEVKKSNIIEECTRYSRGIRCYTMHASKGLEADVVYIIDADNGIIPNLKKLDRMCRCDCEMDAARAIREERALCYVACTRAKEELNIIYTRELSPIFHGLDTYKSFDEIYKFYRTKGNDISAFNQFTNKYVGEMIA